MSDMISVTGADEVVQALEKMVEAYPDRAGKMLRRSGTKLRKKIVENANENLNTNSKHKLSLGNESSYRISQVQGLGKMQFVELSAKSPHFHLVERGHKQVTKSGNIVGEVAGRYYLRRATVAFEEEMPKEAEKIVDALIKEVGL